MLALYVCVSSPYNQEEQMVMSKVTVARRQGRPLEAKVADRLRAEVERDGVRAVAGRLGIAPNTIARGLAGLGVYPGTSLLIEQRLGARR